LSEAIRFDPKYVSAFNERGFAYRQTGNFKQAVYDLDEAIRLNPKFSVAYSNRGAAHLGLGDTARAIADLSEALRLDPNMTPAYTSRGLAYEKNGDLERARADYNAAVSRSAGNFTTTKWAQDTARERLAALSTGQIIAAPATVNTAAPATDRRFALVIGNGAYPGAARLGNPTNDADDVSAALRAVGIDVTEGKDLTLAGVSQIIETFRDKAKGADVALFYYSGHGMQFDEQNWLMPVDAKVTTAFDVRHSNMSLQEMIAEIETSAKTTIVFLDACRNNPLSDELRDRLKSQNRAVGDARGLGPIEIRAPQTMVVFATRPNATAADGNGRNSPFTEAFLQHVKTPGAEIETLMKRVTATVSTKTNGKQQPERLSRLEREFYFVAAR
jgi:hypothetical protein